MPAYVRFFGLIFVIAVAGGVVYNQFRTTNKTIIGAGGRQVIVNTDAPRQSLFNFGCTNLQVEMYWRKNRALTSFSEKGDKRADKNSNRVGH